jgi:hypothetical protein
LVDGEIKAKSDTMWRWMKAASGILIAAAILAARKPSPFDGGKRVPATVSAITDAVRWAEAIMKGIDDRWPCKSP